MDDEMLQTQCRDVAKCISGLSMTLREAAAGGGNGISEIMGDVHKLIQSFKLLGSHYVCELMKKCRELERKSQEVNELSCKLERGEDNGIAGRVKSDEELSEREDDQDKLPEAYSEMQRNLETMSEELNRSRENLARLEGDLVESREETCKLQEELRKMAVSRESLQQLRMKDHKQLVELLWHQSNLKGCLHLIASKESFSPCDFDREFLQMALCRGLDCRIFDEDTRANLETFLKRSIKPFRRTVETQTCSLRDTPATQWTREVTPAIQHNSFFRLLNLNDTAECSERASQIIPEERSKGSKRSPSVYHERKETPHVDQGCPKGPIEYMDLEDSDSEETRRNSSFTPPWPKARKLNDRLVLETQVSKQIKMVSDLMQERVGQEQSMVESLCKMMEDY